MQTQKSLNKFQEDIQYKFKDEKLLKQALTTAAYGNQEDIPHHESLATLGDAILKSILSIKLYDDGINTKGGITILRSELERNKFFRKIALKYFNLPDYIIQTGKEDIIKTIILPNIFEAVAAAIFFDSDKNYNCVEEIIVDKFYALEKDNLKIEEYEKSEESWTKATKSSDLEKIPFHKSGYIEAIKIKEKLEDNRTPKEYFEKHYKKHPIRMIFTLSAWNQEKEVKVNHWIAEIPIGFLSLLHLAKGEENYFEVGYNYKSINVANKECCFKFGKRIEDVCNKIGIKIK